MMERQHAARVRSSGGAPNGGSPARCVRAARWRRDAGRRGAPGARRLAVCLLLAGSLGCASTGPRAVPGAVDADAQAGLDLYAAGEFEMAAHRFGAAAAEARRCREPELERRARAAECTAWLRAGRPGRFAACTDRLETLQSRARVSDPGINTLIALGAIAGGRPLPPLRLPGEVRPVLRAVSGADRQEARR